MVYVMGTDAVHTVKRTQCLQRIITCKQASLEGLWQKIRDKKTNQSVGAEQDEAVLMAVGSLNVPGASQRNATPADALSFYFIDLFLKRLKPHI